MSLEAPAEAGSKVEPPAPPVGPSGSRSDSVGLTPAPERNAMNLLRGVLQSARPKQWLKNGFLFAALLFAQEYDDPAQIGRALGAFFIFCALSSGVYLFNDVADAEKDRLHPQKKHRPVAAGRLRKGEAIGAALVLELGAVACSALLSKWFTVVAVIYLGTNLAYSFWLKHKVIFDVFLVALGFVLRVIAGALVIKVPVSPWILICTMQLALFLALCKRRHELLLMEDGAVSTRAVLQQYSPELLDQMISVVTASSLMSYSLYTVSPEVQQRHGTTNLHLTIPFVLFGIMRYLYLVYKKNLGGSPELILLRDAPMIVDIALFILTVLLVLGLG
jgi:4-hydroxybenzoate polyprenyltransferase